MILESWSIALITCSAVTLIFGLIGASTALRVVRSWDVGSDSALQIRLEERIWLAATLVQFGLVVQIVSVVIFVYAADYFATILTGAMCAAGALSANAYGLPALGCKLATIFLAFLWLILHRLDINSETFPLTTIKSIWLLLLLPFLVCDALLVLLYLANLEPEIITSCCGIIFSGSAGGGYSLLDHTSPTMLLPLTGALVALLTAGSLFLPGRSHSTMKARLAASLILAGGWLAFYLLALVLITVFISPYVYALPHHRCPFDLLQYPYAFTGLPLYLFLHVSVFAGIAGAAASIVSCRRELAADVNGFIRRSAYLSIVTLLLFLLTAGWQPFLYIFSGGQR